MWEKEKSSVKRYQNNFKSISFVFHLEYGFDTHDRLGDSFHYSQPNNFHSLELLYKHILSQTNK